MNNNRKTKSNSIIKVSVSKKRYKAGYIVKEELWQLPWSNEEPVPMKSAYNLRGEYIGDVKTARYFIVKRGITPRKASKQHSTCSIGYCKRDGKWYGWSHRAIHGFGKGDKLFDENYKSNLTEFERDKIPFRIHGRITIKNNKQARQAAINFARSVS